MSQPFVPAATRWGPQPAVLYRGQAEGARAGRSRAASPGLPASSRSRVLWGHWCQLRAGCTPWAESSSPRAPCASCSQHRGSIHWASLGGHGFVCPRTQPAPWDRHSSTLPELTSLPTSTTAEPCSGAQQVKYLPGCWFCSWYCCSSGAEERVGGDFCIATAAAA